MLIMGVDLILGKLSCEKKIVNTIKNGEGIIELKVFNGYNEKNKKQISHYLHFRCGMTHLIYSLKILGKTLKLQKNYQKQK